MDFIRDNWIWILLGFAVWTAIVAALLKYSKEEHEPDDDSFLN